jgi:hypothetical protein
MLDYLSAFLLATSAAICWAGVFAKTFKDNWLQFLGLLGLGMWAPARAWDLWGEYARSSWPQFGMHLALASLLLGTAWKVWQHREPKAPEAPPPQPLPPEHLSHVAGGRGSP